MTPDQILKMRRKPTEPRMEPATAGQDVEALVGKNMVAGLEKLKTETEERMDRAMLEPLGLSKNYQEGVGGPIATITEAAGVVNGAPVEELTIALRDSGLEREDALALLDSFAPMMKEAKQLLGVARAINVTSEDDKRGMKMARETRLAFREIRIKADRLRKKLKEDSVRRGKAIEGVFHVIEYMITPEEGKLLEHEEFAERAAKKRRDELNEKRRQQMIAVEFSPTLLNSDFAEMTEEQFAELFTGAQAAQAQRIRQAEADAKAKADKEMADARERDRIRLENERLKREADERAKADREKADREEKDRVARLKADKERMEREDKLDRQRRAAISPYRWTGLELLALGTRTEDQFQALLAEEKAQKEKRDAERAEQKRKDDAAAEERQKADARARDERDRREKAEKELLDKKKADAAKALEEEKARRKAARAPDAAKLKDMAETIRKLVWPQMRTADGQAAKDAILVWIDDLTGEIEKKAGEL